MENFDFSIKSVWGYLEQNGKEQNKFTTCPVGQIWVFFNERSLWGCTLMTGGVRQKVTQGERGGGVKQITA